MLASSGQRGAVLGFLARHTRPAETTHFYENGGYLMLTEVSEQSDTHRKSNARFCFSPIERLRRPKTAATLLRRAT